MKILCTFPGRAGDLLWALPTLRTLSRRVDSQIDLQICGEFAGLVPLLRLQPYLRYVHADPRWNMSEGWQAPALDTGGYYDQIFHLGYRRWPELGLPFETLYTLNGQLAQVTTPIPSSWYLFEEDLDLSTPWITNVPPAAFAPRDLAIAFSECHFELKLGTSLLVLDQLSCIRPTPTYYLVHAGGRWATDFSPFGTATPRDWSGYAQVFQHVQLVLSCNSGAHVLAVAMGIPVILYEPMEARWNPIFYPLGWDGPQVTRVTGNDGQWTTDSRHTAELIQQKLTELQRG